MEGVVGFQVYLLMTWLSIVMDTFTLGLKIQTLGLDSVTVRYQLWGCDEYAWRVFHRGVDTYTS